MLGGVDILFKKRDKEEITGRLYSYGLKIIAFLMRMIWETWMTWKTWQNHVHPSHHHLVLEYHFIIS